MSEATTSPTGESGTRARWALIIGVTALASVESAQALWAPRAAPTDADWAAAAASVRGEYRPGDLIVAAPVWADPLVRMHFGDLIPIAVAARMDDARYGRVWEIGQRGARAEEAQGRLAVEREFGRLRVRRFEREPAIVTYDFVDAWRAADVFRWDMAPRTRGNCTFQDVRFVCPGTGNEVRQQLVEVDTRIRRAILAPPVVGAAVVLHYPDVPLGSELAVAAGLHDVWARKYATGTVSFKVSIGGTVVVDETIHNRSGWHIVRVDTSKFAQRSLPVSFEISSSAPYLRQFAFAAEARRRT